MGITSPKTLNWQAGESTMQPSSKVSTLKTQEEWLLRVQRQEKSIAQPGRETSSNLKEGQFFVLFISSIDWIRLIHVRKGNMLYSVYHIFLNIIKNFFKI